MASLKQSFSWWCFDKRGVDAPDLLRAAAGIGYQGVEMLPREHWEAAGDLGLRLVSEVGHTALSDGLNRRENHQRIRGELLAKLEVAVEWQIPVLICFSGNRGGLSDEAGLAHCAELLKELAPQAESAGAALAVELLNSKVDHLDYQADHTEWGVQLCEAVDSPSVKLLYDIYHLQIMEGDLIRTIQRHHAHFAHYHTAGNPGRGIMDETQEINYPALYRAITETGYTGYIGHEFIPKGDPVAALCTAFEQCAGA